MNNKCIDTHVHIWNFDRAAYAWLEGNKTILARNYLIDELTPQAMQSGVQEGVLVQAANTIEETAYMLEVAAQTDWLKGVVGWLPLLQPEIVETILEEGYATNPLFKGVRHLIHDEPNPRWLLQEPILQSLQLLANANIPYELVGVLPVHLETMLEVLNKVPQLTVVLDHLNQPPIQQGNGFARWGELMLDLAKHPAVHAKISGLGLTAGKGSEWTAADIIPSIEFIVANFGANRCFCGGDWPVCLLADDYRHTWIIYREALAALLSTDDQQQILYHNAKRFYKL